VGGSRWCPIRAALAAHARSLARCPCALAAHARSLPMRAAHTPHDVPTAARTARVDSRAAPPRLSKVNDSVGDDGRELGLVLRVRSRELEEAEHQMNAEEHSQVCRDPYM
jgi:hypothetical protein